MKPVGIAYRDESPPSYFSWIETRFAIVPPDAEGLEFLSSESLVAASARSLNRLLVSRSVFDLRVLGALHLALFLGGVGLLVAASRAVPWPARAAGAALLVLAFTDVGYVAPSTSFYTQTASLLFLLLTAGAACLAATRRGPAPLPLVAP